MDVVITDTCDRVNITLVNIYKNVINLVSSIQEGRKEGGDRKRERKMQRKILK